MSCAYPDGEPYGLLNHISKSCIPLKNHNIIKSNIVILLYFVIEPSFNDLNIIYRNDSHIILLDGKVIGYKNII